VVSRKPRPANLTTDLDQKVSGAPGEGFLPGVTHPLLRLLISAAKTEELTQLFRVTGVTRGFLSGHWRYSMVWKI